MMAPNSYQSQFDNVAEVLSVQMTLISYIQVNIKPSKFPKDNDACTSWKQFWISSNWSTVQWQIWKWPIYYNLCKCHSYHRFSMELNNKAMAIKYWSQENDIYLWLNLSILTLAYQRFFRTKSGMQTSHLLNSCVDKFSTKYHLTLK